MSSPAKSAVAPLYLFACLLLGGSAQGVWQNMALQLAGIALIGWAAIAPSSDRIPRRASYLLWLAIAAVFVVLLQLVPLPRGLWAQGPRARIAQDLALLGHPLPSLPLSLGPYDSFSTVLCMIPPLALFCTIVKLRAYRPSWLAVALIAGALAGILLGAVQISSPGPDSSWYLFPQTNRGLAVGFFANANHMASLLVTSLPFVAAIGAAGKSRNVQRYSAMLIVLSALILVLIAGIVLNRSVAGYALSVPVLGASMLILLRRTSWVRVWIAGAAGFAVIGAAVLLATTTIGGAKLDDKAASSAQTRQQILVVTSKAIRDYFPMGSGLGTFLQVYRTYESPDAVTTEYVIHAHDDYAEIAMELGGPGIILIVLFLAWWGKAARSVWSEALSNPYARAASIASAAVLIHSLVDFPLRTAAIASAFAMCLALLLERRVPPPDEPADLRPTRHLVVG